MYGSRPDVNFSPEPGIFPEFVCLLRTTETDDQNDVYRVYVLITPRDRQEAPTRRTPPVETYPR